MLEFSHAAAAAAAGVWDQFKQNGTDSWSVNTWVLLHESCRMWEQQSFTSGNIQRARQLVGSLHRHVIGSYVTINVILLFTESCVRSLCQLIYRNFLSAAAVWRQLHPIKFGSVTVQVDLRTAVQNLEMFFNAM